MRPRSGTACLTGAADFVRLAGRIDDLPAAYAASSVVISAAVQAEGVQRATLEAQAMARPVIVSDLSAGADVVLAPPAVSEGQDRMTGMRFPAGTPPRLPLPSCGFSHFPRPPAWRSARAAGFGPVPPSTLRRSAIRPWRSYEVVGRAKPKA